MDNSQQFCSHCGQKIQGTEKFCTNCGAALKPEATDNASNGNVDVNETVNKAKNFSSNYFAWFIKTLKQPSELVSNTHKYFGMVSFAIEGIITAWIMSIFSAPLVDAVNNGLSEYDSFAAMGGMGRNDYLNLSFITLLIFSLALTALRVTAGFLSRRIEGSKVSYLDYANDLAGITNITLVIELVILLFSLISSYPNAIIMILVSVNFLFANVGYVFSLIRDNSHLKFNRVYTVTLSFVCLSIVTFIFSMLFMTIVFR
ncbi:zinc ribbon domain-containing protein [Apilactobacillus sp. TMW 2.2459]|uniref:zinc ribbon domain-containing protein n=1 Tax=Apilactobacillus xinyiensis TaxID=2841032 RepID=UPI00200EC33E|nr:zinc ribbon domain-containing protein [Apilactobacillus xinyiensis]MCL0312443.1 zinc ribbon domain-containing protein [Apilactobacillus xinyiensis]